jgi:hypothetical protein
MADCSLFPLLSWLHLQLLSYYVHTNSLQPISSTRALTVTKLLIGSACLVSDLITLVRLQVTKYCSLFPLWNWLHLQLLSYYIQVVYNPYRPQEHWLWLNCSLDQHAYYETSKYWSYYYTCETTRDKVNSKNLFKLPTSWWRTGNTSVAVSTEASWWW